MVILLALPGATLSMLHFDPKANQPTQFTSDITVRGRMTVDVAGMEIDVDLVMEQSVVCRVFLMRPKMK